MYKAYPTTKDQHVTVKLLFSSDRASASYASGDFLTVSRNQAIKMQRRVEYKSNCVAQ
jgi:hypothetical protein